MSAITKEQVFEAAEALLAAGLTPKVATVREKLGKGSFTTITEYMREWREGQQPVAAPQKEETPKAVIDLAGSLWAAALGVAQEGLQGERLELEKQREEMQEEQREAVAFADNLVEEVERLRDQLQESQALLEIERSAHEATRNLWHSDQTELLQLKAEYNALSERASDYKASAERNQQLYSKSEEENKKLLKQEAEREGIIARLEAAVDKAQSEMKHQVAALVDELDRERARAAKAAQEAEGDRKAVQEAQKASQEAQIAAATLRGEVEALRSLAVAAKPNKQQQKPKAGEANE